MPIRETDTTNTAASNADREPSADREPRRHPIAMSRWCCCGGLLLLLLSGCSLVPDARPRDRFHNPLPQLHRVAVLPFFNQSKEPTLNQVEVAEAYYAELQAIPGFEVLPVGVAIALAEDYATRTGRLADNGEVLWELFDFQELARYMEVDAIVVGSVTDFSPYYPPRMAMTARWYAANPAFHPVPAGYGLPWGTKAEKEIPRRVLLETELEVARAQLATQTPEMPGVRVESLQAPPQPSMAPATAPAGSKPAATPHARSPQEENLPPAVSPLGIDDFAVVTTSGESLEGVFSESIEMEAVEFPVPPGEVACEDEFAGPPAAPLPANWPDPARLIPDPPNPAGPPMAEPQAGPIMSHTRIYRGDDPDFTEKLADYVYANDDRRIGGWRGYLTRSDDFIRFCCYLHITEMLEMRGGRDQSDLILRWPIGRYRR